MQNMDAGWQGFILRSGIEKNEIIHSLIKHSFEREERMEYSQKKENSFLANKTFFNGGRKFLVIQLFLYFV